MDAPFLEMIGIRKAFPGVVASDRVNLSVRAGEVVSLLGENGAGKSTLMKILGGVYQPDAGEIRIQGRAVHIPDVAAAQALGIGFIHQELNVVDSFDVAGNIFLGREPRHGIFRLIDEKRMHAEARPILDQLGFTLPISTPLTQLSIAQQQLVEIAKALSLHAKLLIMDEPTSSLTLSETDRLMDLIRELRNRGVAIIYISHRLGEVKRISDRAVVLRDGKNVGELAADEIDHDRMVRLMVGRQIQGNYVGSNTPVTRGALRVRGARSSKYPESAVSFDATRGEILGFAGLIGSGRTELFETIFGIDHEGTAEVHLDGAVVHIASCRDAIRNGLALVPEDRRFHGLVTDMSVEENVSMASMEKVSRNGLINKSRENEIAEKYRTDLAIKTPHCGVLVANLSGGNQQKVVLAKWLLTAPKVLLFDEPTRGVDVGAKGEIYRLMRRLADEGKIVIMVSSDMEEILQISDRVAVMHEGKIRGVLERPHCSEENIMQLATGGNVSEARPPYEEAIPT